MADNNEIFLYAALGIGAYFLLKPTFDKVSDIGSSAASIGGQVSQVTGATADLLTDSLRALDKSVKDINELGNNIGRGLTNLFNKNSVADQAEAAQVSNQAGAASNAAAALSTLKYNNPQLLNINTQRSDYVLGLTSTPFVNETPLTSPQNIDRTSESVVFIKPKTTPNVTSRGVSLPRATQSKIMTEILRN